MYDAIIVGSGLAGLSSAVEAVRLDPNTSLCILEAADKMGGNSCKASSGVNILTESAGDVSFDFVQDTMNSGGGLSSGDLVQALVDDSHDALDFLTGLGVDLTKTSQLGGHSHSRTHRNPSGPNVGFAVMSPLMKFVAAHPRITLLTGHQVTSLERAPSPTSNTHPDNTNPAPAARFYVHCKTSAAANASASIAGSSTAGSSTAGTAGGSSADSRAASGSAAGGSEGQRTLAARTVILAAGGFGGNRDALRRFAPHCADLPTTNGLCTVAGDAMTAAATSLGAALVDLDQVQVHPTAFVDPANPTSGSKFLAPEALRGSGAILLDSRGTRFANELARRDELTAAIRGASAPVWLVLPASGADLFGRPAIDFYASKGLFTRAATIDELARHIGVDAPSLASELELYMRDLLAGKDAFGKTVFPAVFNEQRETWVAQITPAVHYCMGGLKIESHGAVLGEGGALVEGLFAAGEVTGGVHGRNRLAGNSLLECVVFGRRAAHSALASCAAMQPAQQAVQAAGVDVA